MSETKVRVITAAVVAPFVVLCFLSYSSFIGLVATVALLASYELLKMSVGNSYRTVRRLIINGLITLSSILFGYFVDVPIYVFMVYTSITIIIGLVSIIGEPKDFLIFATNGVFTLYYVSFSLSMFLPIYRFFGPLHALLILSSGWIFDTFAYFVGSRFGKTKISKRISPNKSLEGVFGGLFGVFLYVLLYDFLSKILFEFDIMNISQMVVFSIGFSFLHTVGDIFESAIKRNYGYKDSGAILPGHGGMLDRIDGLLFSVPGYLIFLIIFKGLGG
ncbi:MAG: phosphatidate cytidylyltransferase [Thermotogaceae bacterium]|jgi:phosphatidate cytidylyltransferase|nr:phosphatidate cytidylyltransferase [Thermotogaceae bacterium]MDN5337109.1 phosphatidate cytidylyltransferase [Thermotogaceae bacterium]